MPYEYHVDEDQYVRQAAQMGATGLEPTRWYNPPLYKYILLAEYVSLYLAGHAMGWYASIADFGAQLDLDPSLLFILGRGTSALFSALTVLVAYWIGATAYNRRTGFLGALFLAVAFLPVRDGHFAVNDSAVTFWMSLALLAAVKIARGGTLRWYLIGGSMVGIGFATKYSAVLAVLPLMMAYAIDVMKNKQSHNLRFPLLAGLSALLTTLLVSPFFILKPAKVIKDIYEGLVIPGRTGFEGWLIDPSGGYLFYIKTLAWGLGVGLLLLCLAGILVALLRRDPADLLLLAFVIPAYLLMGVQKMYFARFILPLIPPLLLLGAALLEKAIHKLFTTPRSQSVGMILASVLLIAQPLTNSLRFDYLLTQTDTRTQAKFWIEEHIPAGAHIAMDWPVHCPPLASQDAPEADSKRVYQVTMMRSKGMAVQPLDWYRQQGFEYLIACSHIYNLHLSDQAAETRRQAFYQALDNEAVLAQEIRPYSGERAPDFIWDEIYGPAISLWQRQRPGPEIIIYKLNRR